MAVVLALLMGVRGVMKSYHEILEMIEMTSGGIHMYKDS
jgi:hypothetical protein